MYKYRPTDKARKLLITTTIGNKVVCVGGQTEKKRTPPRLPELIPECTESEYKYLYETRNMLHLIERIELTDEPARAKNANTGKRRRRKKDSSTI